MTEQALPLTTFYAGWEVYQQSLMEIIAPLSPAQLASPTAAHHWSIGGVAHHIVSARVWWFHVWMGEGRADLASVTRVGPADPEGQTLLDAAALVAGLEATWQMIAGALARWTAADLGQSFAPPGFLPEEEQRMYGTRTRRWIIWHVLEHEMNHGGELSLALGSYGMKGIYDVQF